MSDDKRRYLRLPAQSTVFIESVSAGLSQLESSTVVICETLDVSRRGLRVNLDHPLTEAAVLHLGINLPGLSQALYLACEVVWCQPLATRSGTWQAGLKLIDAAQSDIDHWQLLLVAVEAAEHQ